ncbi:hypothetical protein D9M71_618610 [compost metagenome]
MPMAGLETQQTRLRLIGIDQPVDHPGSDLRHVSQAKHDAIPLVDGIGTQPHRRAYAFRIGIIHDEFDRQVG